LLGFLFHRLKQFRLFCREKIFVFWSVAK
jgi:hypothetical protein